VLRVHRVTGLGANVEAEAPLWYRLDLQAAEDAELVAQAVDMGVQTVARIGLGGGGELSAADHAGGAEQCDEDARLCRREGSVLALPSKAIVIVESRFTHSDIGCGGHCLGVLNYLTDASERGWSGVPLGRSAIHVTTIWRFDCVKVSAISLKA
jgi:hypothetical protein